MVPEKFANLAQCISIGADGMNRPEYRSQVCRDGTWQPQNRGAIARDLTCQQRASMNVHRIEFLPTSAEFQLDAAGEPSVMPSDGPPADRFLHTVPLSPELRSLRYPMRHIRQRFLAQLP